MSRPNAPAVAEVPMLPLTAIVTGQGSWPVRVPASAKVSDLLRRVELASGIPRGQLRGVLHGKVLDSEAAVGALFAENAKATFVRRAANHDDGPASLFWSMLETFCHSQLPASQAQAVVNEFRAGYARRLQALSPQAAAAMLAQHQKQAQRQPPAKT